MPEFHAEPYLHLAGLSLTMRELLGRSGAVTFSLEGLRGEPLRGLAHLAARAAA